MANSRSNHEITVRAVGGPTAVIELGGLRLLTDPTFSPPGEYRSSSGALLVKTAGPGLSPEQIGPVDVVLLSHDQHPDNLDEAGRKFLTTVPLVLTTPDGARRLGEPARPLAPWEHHDLGDTLRVTAVPARHGPDGCEPVTGAVTGFVLSGPGLPSVYVSGDNASIDVVREVAERTGPIDMAVLFLGAARVPPLFDGALLTLDSALGTEATRILDAATVVPVHFEQWQHFTEGADRITSAFAAAGFGERLRLLRPAESVTSG